MKDTIVVFDREPVVSDAMGCPGALGRARLMNVFRRIRKSHALRLLPA